ncbi:MAG: DUF2784 domain-containing protein [Pseudomonadota bacterium]
MSGYQLAADALLLLHVGLALFLVVGLALVWIGAWRGWLWVRQPYFRIAHLASIGVVALQAWLGRICPLTIWEMALRERAGEATYDGAFIAHWLQALLYYDAPLWAFAVVYTAFAILVIASWVWVPPRRR